MADQDLTKLLNDWPMEHGQVNARVITGRDDVPKLQVRIDLGILQMEMDHRPDGAHPDDANSLLESHTARRDAYEDQTGSLTGFVLSAGDCRGLRAEAIQFHHRYVALFALGDFERVVRDTQHSLKIFDLCGAYGETDLDRSMLEQFRPQVVMMRRRAEAEQAIKAKRADDALRALDAGLQELRLVYEEAGAPEEAWEQSNEAMLLRGMRDALVPKLPSSQRAELEERLRAALDAENYELAAILRDELRML